MAADAVNNWAKLKVVDLKTELKKRGLSTVGRKEELVNRLSESDSAEAQGGQNEEQVTNNAEEPVGQADEPSEQKAGSYQATEAAEAAEAAEATETAEAVGPVEAVEATKPLPQATEATETAEDVAPSEATLPASSDQVESVSADQTESTGEGKDEAPPAAVESEVAPTEGPTEDSKALSSIDTEIPILPGAIPPPISAVPASEVVQDAQKRKRRSATPPPSVHVEESSGSNKRMRLDDEPETAALEPQVAPQVRADEQRQEPEAYPSEPKEQETTNGATERETTAPNETKADAAEKEAEDTLMGEIVPARENDRADKSTYGNDSADEDDEDMDVDVPPAIHPATKALYINNFMRPLRPAMLEEHLAYLASPPSTRNDPDPAVIVSSYLDSIKTHAFVIFRSVSAASRVRAALHGRVWPDDSNRRPLWADFVPPERVSGWIEQEQAESGARGSLKKWEVVYNDNGEGGDGVVATLQVVGANGNQGPASRFPPSSQPQAFAGASASGPSIEGAPRGPRARMASVSGPGNSGPPGDNYRNGKGNGNIRQDLDYVHTTNERPRLDYQPVHPDLARRRMDIFKETFEPTEAQPPSGEYSKNNNRYTFEEGDRLVDRGPEKFAGIRPPHQRQEQRRPRFGGGGGGDRRRRRRQHDDYRPSRQDERRYDNWDDRSDGDYRNGRYGRGGRDYRDDRDRRENRDYRDDRDRRHRRDDRDGQYGQSRYDTDDRYGRDERDERDYRDDRNDRYGRDYRGSVDDRGARDDWDRKSYDGEKRHGDRRDGRRDDRRGNRHDNRGDRRDNRREARWDDDRWDDDRWDGRRDDGQASGPYRDHRRRR